MTTTIRVSGMTCDHCVAAVKQELSALPGITGVDVELVPGAASTVLISGDPTPDASLIAAAIDDAGYKIV